MLIRLFQTLLIWTMFLLPSELQIVGFNYIVKYNISLISIINFTITVTVIISLTQDFVSLICREAIIQRDGEEVDL